MIKKFKNNIFEIKTRVLSELFMFLENFRVTVDEMAVLKFVNRKEKLQSKQGSDVKKDDVIVSIMADLQERQDQESTQIMKFSVQKVGGIVNPNQLCYANKIFRFAVFIYGFIYGVFRASTILCYSKEWRYLLSLMRTNVIVN